MAEIIVAVFDTTAHADAAESDLRAGGIPLDLIRRYTSGETGAPVIDTSRALSEHHEPEHKGFWASLFGSDEHEDRSYYAEHEQAGRTIVSVHTVDNLQSTEVMRILEAHSPAEMEAQRQGYAGAANTTITDHAEDHAEQPSVPAAEPVSPPARTTTTEEVIPLSAEELKVGKRTIDQGTTRIRRYVVERPVEETVALRDEKTTVERRTPVAGTAAGEPAFEERTIEVHETTEEPVVSKAATVVEEVVVKKEATERTETVRDSLRKEEVEIHNDNEPNTSGTSSGRSTADTSTHRPGSTPSTETP